MRIEPARVGDAPAILALQKLAYQSEADIYGDYSIPPLTETLEALQNEFADHLILKASIDGVIVGSVRAQQRGDTCHIGRMMVHPDFQNLGIGTRLMKVVEVVFLSVRRYELFTGYRSTRNLYLYQKLGYCVYERKQLTPKVALVYLEKTVYERGLQP